MGMTKKLTHRELDVIALRASGLTGKQVATRLQIAHSTVQRHIHSALGVIGVRMPVGRRKSC